MLGFYFIHAAYWKPFRDMQAQHVLWMIRNQPAHPLTGSPYCQLDSLLHPEGYQEAKRLWEEHLSRSNRDTRILSNAASFFTLPDPLRAEPLYRRLIELEPGNPEWRHDLSHLFGLKGDEAGMQSQAAQERVFQAEEAFRLSERGSAQFYSLTDLPEAALEAGETEKAADYAEELLKMAEGYTDDWNYGNAIHEGHTVLGRIALKGGNRDLAKQHLLDSAAWGSPQLNSFGPSMELARELLAAGETDAVIAYLERCGEFWKCGYNLKHWIREIRRKGTTDFNDHWTAYLRLFLKVLRLWLPWGKPHLPSL
ncbi:MAG: hypothetical protein KY468_17870 [Armatimonadetes bacterium]|nr:hypothetical protein [Armatimonadota bacterium]